MLIRVLLVLLATTSAAFSQGYGNWSYDVEKDVLTDENVIDMQTDSKEHIYCGYGGAISSPLKFAIWCRENRIYLYVAANHCFFTGEIDNYGSVKYRVDNLPAKTRTFSESSDGNALGLWLTDRAVSFIDELVGYNTLIMRVTPYQENSETLTFSLKGFDAKVAKLRKSCGQ